jgi:hypothetical protein
MGETSERMAFLTPLLFASAHFLTRGFARRLVLPLGFETSCALALPFRPLPLLLLLLRLHRIPAAWLNPCQFP